MAVLRRLNDRGKWSEELCSAVYETAEQSLLPSSRGATGRVPGCVPCARWCVFSTPSISSGEGCGAKPPASSLHRLSGDGLVSRPDRALWHRQCQISYQPGWLRHEAGRRSGAVHLLRVLFAPPRQSLVGLHCGSFGSWVPFAFPRGQWFPALLSKRYLCHVRVLIVLRSCNGSSSESSHFGPLHINRGTQHRCQRAGKQAFKTGECGRARDEETLRKIASAFGQH